VEARDVTLHGGTVKRLRALDESGDRRTERRRLVASVLRICIVTPSIFLVYALAPLEGTGSVPGTLLFIGALIGFLALTGYQVYAVIRSPFPRVRAVEAATMCVPVLIVMFSLTYFLTSGSDLQSFSQPLSRLDAVYFTTTVFATVGFGDITPVSEVARVMVTVQMTLDIVVVGLLAKVLLRAAERRRASIRRRG
jgi:voltage-gated potassium channel